MTRPTHDADDAVTSLSLSTLDRLPRGVTRPAYDPAELRVGIVHLGLGAFHRAHQAVYTDDIVADDPRWGICGVSMKTPRATQPLAAQDGLYTVVTRDADATAYRVVGTLREALFAGDDAARVVARIADPQVSVVTLTVTEKGYCRAADGSLDLAHPDVAHDLRHPGVPRSAIGVLVEALHVRRTSQRGPLTIVCCDNLPSNGKAVAKLVDDLASARDETLARWVRANAAFPATMVDRIVPSVTPSDLDDVQRTLGVKDAAPVVAESFGQWVIESRFATPMPDWASAGAEIVGDVEPYETMKLRMLNGSHSSLAYLGFLMGHDTIARAAGDPLLRAFVERQMIEEIAPSFSAPPGVHTDDYARSLVRRFRNPALPHRTAQVAMDGSQKLPQRWIATVRSNLAAGRSIEALALSIAAWMRYVYGRDESGARIEIADPLAARYAELARASGPDPEAFAHSLLALDAIFGHDVARDPRLVEPVTDRLCSLFAVGVRDTLEAFVARRR